MLKTCPDCNVNYEARSDSMRCKECWKAVNRERTRKYEKENPEKRLATYKKYRSTDEYRKRSRERYYSLPENKRKARYYLTNAIRDGKIQRPDKCELCSGTGRIEGHHHKGYAKKHWLDIQWLCTPCHKAIERKEA